MGKMKTIGGRRFLNEFIIEGMPIQDFYSALYLEDLNNIHFHNDIIDESVLKDEVIQDLFNYIIKNNRTLMNIEEILNYIPIGTKWHRLLKKSKSYEHRLYIDICQFDPSFYFLELKYFCKNKIPDYILIDKAIEMQKIMTKNTEGAFISFNNHKEFGIIFLNIEKGVNIFSFKHEMIHYFNWMKGAFKNSVCADENFYKEEISTIKKNISPNFNELNIQYITSSNEYESLLNDFLNILKNIKIKYFQDMNFHDFAKMIIDKLYKNDSLLGCYNEITELDSCESYCKKLMSYEYFREIRNKSSFLMIVFFSMIHHKFTNITNHIYGAFS